MTTRLRFTNRNGLFLHRSKQELKNMLLKTRQPIEPNSNKVIFLNNNDVEIILKIEQGNQKTQLYGALWFLALF